jgi:hypothetical protein
MSPEPEAGSSRSNLDDLRESASALVRYSEEVEAEPAFPVGPDNISPMSEMLPFFLFGGRGAMVVVASGATTTLFPPAEDDEDTGAEGVAIDVGVGSGLRILLKEKGGAIS